MHVHDIYVHTAMRGDPVAWEKGVNMSKFKTNLTKEQIHANRAAQAVAKALVAKAKAEAEKAERKARAHAAMEAKHAAEQAACEARFEAQRKEAIAAKRLANLAKANEAKEEKTMVSMVMLPQLRQKWGCRH